MVVGGREGGAPMETIHSSTIWFQHAGVLQTEAEDRKLPALFGYIFQVFQNRKFFNFSSGQNFYTTQYPLHLSIDRSSLVIHVSSQCSALSGLRKDIMKRKEPLHTHYIPTQTQPFSPTGGCDSEENMSRFGNQYEQFCSAPPCSDIQEHLCHPLEALLGIFFQLSGCTMFPFRMLLCPLLCRNSGSIKNNYYSLPTHHSNNYLFSISSALFCVHIKFTSQ